MTMATRRQGRQGPPGRQPASPRRPPRRPSRARRAALALVLALLGGGAAGGAFGQEALRRDLRDFESGERWIYDDWKRAQGLAAAERKPIFVVFRCVP
jgi:hypothetical protein